MRIDLREDGGAQLRNAGVRSTFERLLRQQARIAHQIQPRGIGGREMKVDVRMAERPPQDRGRAVGRQIIQDHVDFKPGLTVDSISRERDETWAQCMGCSGRYLASGDIERGEQIERAVPDVVEAVGRVDQSPSARSVAPAGAPGSATSHRTRRPPHSPAAPCTGPRRRGSSRRAGDPARS